MFLYQYTGCIFSHCVKSGNFFRRNLDMKKFSFFFYSNALSISLNILITSD